MGKESAEQKLLKLIEKTDAQDGGDTGQAGGAVNPDVQNVYDSVRGVGQVALALPPFVNDFLASLKHLMAGSKSGGGFGLKEVNKLLALGLMVLLVFFGVDFSKGMTRLEKETSLSFEQDPSSMPEAIKDVASLLPTFKEFKEYIKVVDRRNIFQPYERKLVKNEETIAAEELGIRHVTEQTKDLKLVGISWLDTPESASALVENTISGVTYFLRRGEKINDVLIEDIFAESIIVSFQGEEMEMKL